MSRQWVLPNGTGISETGIRQWNALGVQVSETFVTLQTLTPSLFTNTQTFFAPTISLVLAPSLVTNAQTFFGPTITTGAVGLSPPLLTNTQTFFAPTVTPGAVTLAPPLLTNDQTFYLPTITQGEAPLVGDERTFLLPRHPSRGFTVPPMARAFMVP